MIRLQVPRAAVALTFATSIAACSLVPAGPTVVTLRAADGSHELPVMLDDPAGLVTTVEAGRQDDATSLPEVSRVGDDTVAFSWLGGACDARSQVRVIAHDLAISFGVRTDQQVGLGCNAMGIPRSVLITFREPIGNHTLDLAAGV